jgi:hypothetical protein
MLTSKQMVDDKSRNDGLSSTWDAWTEQRRIFRSVPFLKLRVLEESLSSASLMPIDEVLMLYVIVGKADPLRQTMLVPYSGVISQSCRIAPDGGGGVHDCRSV